MCSRRRGKVTVPVMRQGREMGRGKPRGDKLPDIIAHEGWGPILRAAGRT